MNPTKRKLELSSAIIAIVISGLLIWGLGIVLIVFESMIISGGNISQALINSEFALAAIVFISAITTLVFAILVIIRLKKPNGEYRSSKGIKITFLVCLSVISFYSIIFYVSFVFVIAGAAPLVLFIIAMCQKDTANIESLSSATAENISSGIDAKLAELNKYKNLGIIDDVQYKRAIENIISKL